MLSRVDRKKSDQPVDRWEENESFCAKRDAFRIEAETWRMKSRLMERNTLEHEAGESTSSGALRAGLLLPPLVRLSHATRAPVPQRALVRAHGR